MTVMNSTGEPVDQIPPGSIPRPRTSPENDVRDQVDVDPTSDAEAAGLAAADVDADQSGRTGFRARVRTVTEHRATRAAVRQAVYLGAGVRLAHMQRQDARGTARHERMMRAAEARGDHAVAQEWAKLAALHRKERHEQRMHRWKMVPRIALGVGVGTGLTFAGLLALGIVLAVTSKNLREVIVPMRDLFGLVAWVCGVVDALWLPAVLLTPAAVLLSWWGKGRKHAEVPQWLMTAEQRESAGGEPITPSVVVTAFRDLGISSLRTAIKAMADAGAGMLGPIRIAGCGVEVDVMLPSGVSTAEIQAKRRKLAENLGRHMHEVFISIPQAARTVRLWIADSGALDQPIGPSPLVIDPDLKASYKSARMPWGQDLRGAAALISLYQRHLLITGLSNQGKTAALRALALWLVLDPTVQLRIADLKGVGDWRMFDGIATVLIEGPTDEHAIAATEMLEDGVAEMERRLLAPAGTKFKPLILIVDEAQNAFMNPLVGEDKRPYGGTKATSRYFMAARKIHNQGRAVDVLLWQGTQDPTDRNLPVLVREGAHIRAALVLGTEAQSRMALGDKAVDGGAAPHELRQGVDKGTLVVAGDGVPLPPGQASITIRTHYIDDEAAARIAERAKARRKPTATRTDADAEPPAPVDTLADIAEVIADERVVRTEEVVHRLKVLRPDHYRGWNTSDLTAALAPTGAAPYKTDGRMHVGRDRVREAIEAREAENEAVSAA